LLKLYNLSLVTPTLTL